MSMRRTVNRALRGIVAPRVRIWAALGVTVGFLAGCSYESGRSAGYTPPISTRGGSLHYSIPAYLLRNLPPDRTCKDVADVFDEMSRQSEAMSPPLKKVDKLRLRPNISDRWMVVSFQERKASTVWIVEGQIISDDRLGPVESVKFDPRFITNSTDMDGTGIDERSARKGWGILRPDLEILAGAAVEAVGARRGWGIATGSRDNASTSPEPHEISGDAILNSRPK
jgi:hypothetical protein